MRIVGLSILAVTTSLIAGCSHDTDDAPATPAPVTSGTPQMSDLQAPPQRLVIDATIRDGELIGAGKQLQATVNETIVVRISSDSPDELHVDSTPEHRFPIAAAPNQSFQFSVGSPGNVAIRVDKLHQTVATVHVR